MTAAATEVGPAGDSLGVPAGGAVWAVRLDVQAVLVEYLAALDERRFADATVCFTDDGVLQFDDVEVAGRAAIEAGMHRQLGVLDLTHHMVTNVRVRVDDEHPTAARLAAQAIGTHRWTEDGEPRQSVLGGHYDAALQLTAAGWRFTRLQPSFLWTVGDTWEH